MIKEFKAAEAAQPEGGGHFQLGPAAAAGLIAGLILLVVPRGDPWAAISFFSFVVMGRSAPPGFGLPLGVAWLIHLAVAEAYGLIISALVARVTHTKAILTGGLIGVVLYWINLAVVSSALPHWRGNEFPVLVTHVVFGLIAAGLYRGLLRRRLARTEVTTGSASSTSP